MPIPDDDKGKGPVSYCLPCCMVDLNLVDPELLKQLVEVEKVPEELAALALLRTFNAPLEEVRDYVIQHQVELMRTQITLFRSAPLRSSTNKHNNNNTMRRSLKESGGSDELSLGADSGEDLLGMSGSDSEDFDAMDGFEPLDLRSSTGIAQARRGRNTLTASGIDNARQTTVEMVAAQLCVPPWFATALLSHFKWQTESCLEAYLEDPERVQQTLGISPLAEGNVEEHQSITCSICWEESHENVALPCHHVFCKECMLRHLEVNVDQGRSFDIDCPHSGCNMLVPEYLVQKHAPLEMYRRYAKFANNAFVETRKDMRWCPRPGCQNAVYDPIQERNCRAGYCACGYRFCFDCNLEAHSPINCEVMKDWRVKLDQDAASLHWIASNTKACPECKISIQKNDGCFQMTCYKCKAQWCWLCQKPWATHPNHFRCNTFDTDKLSNTVEYLDPSAQRSTDVGALADFVAQLKMFTEHDQADKLEDNIRQQAKKQIADIRSDPSRVYDTEFLPRAYAQLAQLRSVLKYLYVESWDLGRRSNTENQRVLVQFQQDSLSRLAETFSNELKKPISEFNRSRAATIMDLTSSAKTSVQNILQDINHF